MASLPPQHQLPTSHRASQEEASSNPASTSSNQQSASRLRNRSEVPDDSQTVLLNNPSPIEDSTAQSQAAPDTEAHGTQQNHDEDSAKKCWICFSDSTEDTVDTSPWRHPCPCALEAHEDCLLDWIADLEANSRGSVSGPRKRKVQCPQCQNEIKLERPRELVVEAVQELEKLAHRIVMPGSVAVLLNMVHQASTLHGIHTIRSVFGTEDGFRIIAPLVFNAVPSQNGPKSLLQDYANRIQYILYNHWRLYFGLPLITPVLVLSRTRGRFADAILPLLPVFFFATQSYSLDEPLDFDLGWPPSAGFAFSVLPYVRSAYNYYFEKVWGERQRKWLRELQPRQMQEPEETIVQEVDEDARNVFELRIEGDVWEEGAEGEQVRVENEAVNQDAPAAPVNAQGRRPQQANRNANNNRQAPPNQVGGVERRYALDPLAFAETVLGALLFPKISEISGELLKLLLPSSWTAPFANGKPTGLLQQKWGRSLIGGCAFVAAKDLLLLYVRWRMACLHRHRKVLDVQRPAARTARA